MEQNDAPAPSSSASAVERPLKRFRSDQDANVGRRKSACQTCRLRKIKCDLKRPICSMCETVGNECVYLAEPPKQTLDSLGEALTGRLDYVTKQLEELRAVVQANGTRHPSRSVSSAAIVSPTVLTHTISHQVIPEPSRDFSHIPPHRTTADTVLMWPIYGNKFTENFLIDPLLTDPSVSDPNAQSRAGTDLDYYSMLTSLAPLDEERIPVLVDVFLQNVHTKNPVVDVETLVQKSRDVATKGLGWDAWSCLILLACALGSIAKPFGAWEKLPDDEMYFKNPTMQRELQQGENCFVLACRRLGLLKMTMLASQCHFFAGVYLMYTMRPLLSWERFHHASITYQLYLKTNARLTEDLSILDHAAYQPPGTSMRKQSRLEQRLYWSCFKSETEFRVELPLPQSEIAEYEFPKLFPSPPSPPSPVNEEIVLGNPARFGDGLLNSPPMLSPQSTRGFSLDGSDSIRRHAKHLCREEESWYYYLTEVALRRIGNRIINTFFASKRSSWLNIEPYLDIAVEFEAQVSSWYANLPPAMQRYETNSSIRQPRRESINGIEVDFVSRELSWATENRLLEMRSWLYQPFLYYLVHVRPPQPAEQSMASPVYTTADQAAAGRLGGEATGVLWTLIIRGIECNVTILETRSLPHRHHGLWYDLRAIMTASLILLAIVKSGHGDLIPGGIDSLLGESSHWTRPELYRTRTQSSTSSNVQRSHHINGTFGKTLAQLRLWSAESPDMIRHADVLESLIREIMV